MARTVTPISTIDAIDTDIREAVANRDVAFRKLVVRDDDRNRDAFAEACGKVDSLLEMRHGMIGEGGGNGRRP